eukprot:GHVN01024776.1.p1 GENE.GHVN01024776.1~~GHVN01024776.1.p1  ORF type:complete len:140 (+),score=11.04 GHVN01024776.1:1474-1893(+)
MCENSDINTHSYKLLATCAINVYQPSDLTECPTAARLIPTNVSADITMQREAANGPIQRSYSQLGLPHHALDLKFGSVVMLVRNGCVTNGLCSGTRLIIVETHKYFVLGEICSGFYRGTLHPIPRITLTPLTVGLPSLT